jgi:hypothetical protein
MWGFSMGMAVGCSAGLACTGRYDEASLGLLTVILLWGVWMNEKDKDVVEVIQ